jgi:hypothetical protein
MFKGIVTKKVFRKLLLIILGIFCFFSLMSALVVYQTSHMPLSPHDEATYTIITRVKESLIAKTIIINLVFYLFTAIGVAFLSVLYSHRIAGPLFKVKKYAAMLGEGKYDESIRFRKKDAVHTLASALNEVAQGCQAKTDRFVTELKKLEEGLLLLNSLPDKSKEKYNLIKKLRELDAKIKEDNQKLKI